MISPLFRARPRPGIFERNVLCWTLTIQMCCYVCMATAAVLTASAAHRTQSSIGSGPSEALTASGPRTQSEQQSAHDLLIVGVATCSSCSARVFREGFRKCS